MTWRWALIVLLLTAINVLAWIIWGSFWAIISGGASQCVADGCGPEPSMWEATFDWAALLLPPAMICYFLNMSFIRWTDAHSSS